ncbi:hypothetical protein [Lentibacillus sp. Marseille-P4043]|uniref:hypothetical protein n=1 Tax=Lentibacillus sp. Marseille-P4043 TaxID=2040293 RepID=UPI00131A4BA7|nr:hypothetical protein [Lentibacillus sp. Marseille-P4043]
MRVLIEKSPAVTSHFIPTTKLKKQQTMRKQPYVIYASYKKDKGNFIVQGETN